MTNPTIHSEPVDWLSGLAKPIAEGLDEIEAIIRFNGSDALALRYRKFIRDTTRVWLARNPNLKGMTVALFRPCLAYTIDAKDKTGATTLCCYLMLVAVTAAQFDRDALKKSDYKIYMAVEMDKTTRRFTDLTSTVNFSKSNPDLKFH